MRRGRPPGKRKRDRGFSREKRGALKRLKDVRYFKQLVYDRKGAQVPQEVKAVCTLEETAPIPAIDDTLLCSAWRWANKINGEGPPGLSLYGEISRGGMTKIFTVLATKAGFGIDSNLLDVGCGIGKVLLHATIGFNVNTAKGVEMSEYRVNSARAVLDLVGKKVPEVQPSLKRIQLLHCDIASMNSWDGITHVYSYDLGIPKSVYSHLLRLWTQSSTVEWFVSFRRPDWLWKCGFDLDLIEKVLVKQQGTGGSNHTAYVYHKRNNVD